MKALVLPARQSLAKVCSPRCKALLEEHFTVTYNDSDVEITPEQLAGMVDGVDVLLTSWGSPVLTSEALANAKNLKYLGHAAGTLKNRIPDETFERGVRVFSGAKRIARSVAEYCMAAIFTSLRNMKTADALVRAGNWESGKVQGVGHELSGSTVGIVSASSTAREFLQMLAPYHCTIKLFDPFLSEEGARALGAEKATLEEVMRCPIVSNHAPVLPETHGMLRAEHLRLIPDGGLFVNSARAVLVDNAALYAELTAGRIHAVLDVFDKEPLTGEELITLQSLPNVLLTPHIAGATVDEWQDLLYCMVRDILRAEQGQPTDYEILAEKWAILA